MAIETKVIPSRLSDGSTVWFLNIRDSNTGQNMSFDAISERDAGELWDKIAQALSDHTNLDVKQI